MNKAGRYEELTANNPDFGSTRQGMEALEKEVAILEESISLFLRRLEPVSILRPAACSEPGGAPAPEMCELGARLSRVMAQLSNLRRVIEDHSRRLDL